MTHQDIPGAGDDAAGATPDESQPTTPGQPSRDPQLSANPIGLAHAPAMNNNADDVVKLVDHAIALATEWAEENDDAVSSKEREASEQLSALVSDPEGLEFAVRFVDRVARPEDDRVAATALRDLSSSRAAPQFLGRLDRGLLSAGSFASRMAPRLVVPLARRRLNQMIGHLILDSEARTLDTHLANARETGRNLNLNLLGEAVLGEDEAQDRATRIEQLIRHPDVHHISLKVSSLVSQINTWDIEGSVARATERLRPIYRAALEGESQVFINLDMEEYSDLDLTVEVFTSLLAEPELLGLRAGIVLQAYLPDSAAALDRLIAFGNERASAGGANITIRLVKGANLSMERVEAALHNWNQATYTTKAETDASYLALFERALRPDASAGVRIAVASHNLFDIALAHLLASSRNVSDNLDVEMLQGMAPAQSRAVERVVGKVALYTPVVAADDMDAAVAYLIRRLEENAVAENFLYAQAVDTNEAWQEQEDRFRRSATAAATVSRDRKRTPHRPPASKAFVPAIDTDPALPESRVWAAENLTAPRREPTSPHLSTTDDVDEVVATARNAFSNWSETDPNARAEVLRRAADELEARRGALVGQMAAEGGKTIGESDPEISEAIDFARYYSATTRDLAWGSDALDGDGATFDPAGVVLVTPPWNFPVAIPIGGVLAAVGAGNAAVIKPAPPVPGVSEIAVEALRAALDAEGFDPNVVQVIRTDEDDVGRHLVAHEGVDKVVLTGAFDTAETFISWRSSRPGGHGVVAETSGKNSMIITPAADYDLAVADLVKSAFGHAGQKCSAASLAILVGSTGESERFMRQFLDAVRSLRVGWPSDLGAVMGPVISPPSGTLLRGLTELEPGESWLVEPQPLDDTGRLWSPGVRDGVKPGSWYHVTECFGPVLGIMRADTLDEAIALQNAPAYGLTGALHSLNEAEIDHWLNHVEVGNAYVNRHATGAIVNRQPFGGWKGSSVGPGAKAGGPNYVSQFGTWRADGLPRQLADPTGNVRDVFADFTGLVQNQSERTWLRAAVRSDAHVWDVDLSRAHDPSALIVEANYLHYLPHPAVEVRAGEGTQAVELVRVLLAAERTGTAVHVSLDPEVSDALKDMATRGEQARRGLRRLGAMNPVVEDDGAFVARVAARPARVRLLGRREKLVEALASANIDVRDTAVLATGRRELLAMVREQAVSRTMHRMGHLPPEVVDPEARGGAVGD